MLSFLKPKLAVCNCRTNEYAVIGDFPAWIGGSGANFAVDDSDHALCEFTQEEGVVSLHALNGGIVLNGDKKTDSMILLDKDYAMQLDGHLILFSFTRKHREWLASRNRDSWRIMDLNSQIIAGPARLDQLHAAAAGAPDKAILSQAYSTTGFHLVHVAPFLL